MSAASSYIKQLREARKAAGQCPRCAESLNGDTEYTYCAPCRSKGADNALQARCRKPKLYRRIRTRWNQKHAARVKLERQQRDQKRIDAGLCVRCGLEPARKFKNCLYCRGLDATRKQKKRDALQKGGSSDG